MKQKWLLTVVIFGLLFILAGCGKTVEEQINTGVASAETIFETNPIETNKTIGNIKLYAPSGYSVEQSDDVNNLILKKGKEQYLLFINEYEKEDSRLHYELLKNDTTKNIIREQTFEFDGAFGFTAVVEVSEESYELIASSGGVKISTISKDKKIDQKLSDMMTIARSVQLVE